MKSNLNYYAKGKTRKCVHIRKFVIKSSKILSDWTQVRFIIFVTLFDIKLYIIVYK